MATLLPMVFFLAPGLTSEAQAFSLANNNLAVALYGNNTETLYNLGSTSALLAPGTVTTFTLDPSAAAGANPVRFSLVSWDLTEFGDPLSIVASSSLPLSSYTVQLLNNVSTGSTWVAAAVWSINGSFPGDNILASDFYSFTSTFGTNGTLAWGFPVRMSGVFGSTLYLLSGDIPSNSLADLGTAFLSADGTQLTITGSPVPLPAAGWLMLSGLVGLLPLALSRHAGSLEKDR